MVIVLVPFVGSWTLIIAVFATQQRERKPTRKNHDTLLKKQAYLLILLSALVLHGMWALMGISQLQRSAEARCCIQWIPAAHFILCPISLIRNGLLESSFTTPGEEVIAAFLFFYFLMGSKQAELSSACNHIHIEAFIMKKIFYLYYGCRFCARSLDTRWIQCYSASHARD